MKPCPFCGSDSVSGSYISMKGIIHWYVIICDGCGAIVTFDKDDCNTAGGVERKYDTRVYQ